MDLRSLIAAQERAVAAAGARGEKARLLDDGDQNIGNQLVIKTPFVTLPPMTIPTQNPDRLLNLNATSKSGQLITVFLGAETTPNTPINRPPTPFLTGIVEFGNGSRFTNFEMDIPLGPTQLNLNQQPTAPQNGGILITVPAGTLRIYARSDGALITPNMFGTLPVDGLGNSPPGRLLSPVGAPGTPASDVLVTAFATYFTRPAVHSPTKTLWLGRANTVDGIVFAGNFYAIPAFARTIAILRDPLAVAIEITLTDTYSNTLDTIVIPGGTRSDNYKIPGNASRFTITSTTPNPVVAGTILQAVFELEV